MPWNLQKHHRQRHPQRPHPLQRDHLPRVTVRSQNLHLQRLEAEARRCLREAHLARQLGHQRRQQQQQEPVQAEPKGWASGLSMSLVEAPPGCRSKRAKSSWLNCRAASCGRPSHPAIKKTSFTKNSCLKQCMRRFLTFFSRWARV